MRLLNWTIFLTLVILGLFIVSEDIEQTRFNELLTNVSESNMNVTLNVPHTNPYNENITLNNSVYNIIHYTLYAGFGILHTTLGTITNLTWDYITIDNINFLIDILLIILVIWIISKGFTPVGIVYVALEDWHKEKNKKYKPWLLLLTSILIILALFALIIGLILVF